MYNQTYQGVCNTGGTWIYPTLVTGNGLPMDNSNYSTEDNLAYQFSSLSLENCPVPLMFTSPQNFGYYPNAPLIGEDYGNITAGTDPLLDVGKGTGLLTTPQYWIYPQPMPSVESWQMQNVNVQKNPRPLMSEMRLRPSIEPKITRSSSASRSSNSRKLAVRAEIQLLGCSFCRNNGEMRSMYLTHRLKENGIITCPVLRNYICPICKAQGDEAHTISYCPKKTEDVSHFYVPTAHNAAGRLCCSQSLRYKRHNNTPSNK